MATGAKTGGGGGGGSSAIRAGRAFIELFGDDAKLRGVLNGAQRRLQGFGAFIGKIGLGLSASGAGLLAPLTALLKGGVDRADQIGDIADVFGLTAESASKMASAFEMAGSTIEDMETALSKLAASNQSGKPLDEYFFDVADGINAIDDASQRFQKAKEIFGDKFARKFIDASGDVSGFVKDAPGLTGEEIANAKKLNVELAKTGIVLKSALLPVLEIIMPIVKGFLQFVQANAQVLQIAFAVGAGLAAVGSVLAVLGGAITAVAAAFAVAIPVLTTGIGFIGPAFASVVAAITPFLTVATAVKLALAGLAGYFLTQSDIGQAWGDSIAAGFSAAASSIKGFFLGIADTAATTWGGITDALKAGDLELAGSIALAGLEAMWQSVVYEMTSVWNDFKGVFVDGWHEVTDGVTDVLTEMWGIVSDVFDGIWNTISQVIDAVKDAFQSVKGTVMDVVEFIKPALAPIVLPFMALASIIEQAWDGLSMNIMQTLNNFASWVEKTFERITAGIGNAFRQIARVALDNAISVAEALDSLDPTDSLKGAIETAKGLRNAIGEDVDITAKIAEIEKRRVDYENTLKEGRAKNQANRDAVRAEDMAKAKEQLDQANAELDKLRAKAAAAAVKPPEAVAKKIDNLPSQMQLLNTVRGGYASNATSQQFAFGKVVDKNAQAVAKNTAVLPEIKNEIQALRKAVEDGSFIT